MWIASPFVSLCRKDVFAAHCYIDVNSPKNASVGSEVNNIRGEKVLSLSKTIKRKSTSRGKAFRRKVNTFI